MTQRQVKKLLRFKGYHFSKINFPFGSERNNTLFSINCSRYSTPLYFMLLLEGNNGFNEQEYFLLQITYERYKTLYSKFDK